MREAKIVHCNHWLFQSDVWSSVYLIVQMGISYTLMLLVMLYDFGFVLSACAGLGLGHYFGRKWRKHHMNETNMEVHSGVMNHYEDESESQTLIKGNGHGHIISYSATTSTTSLCDLDSEKTPHSRAKSSTSLRGEKPSDLVMTPDTTPCCRV